MWINSVRKCFTYNSDMNYNFYLKESQTLYDEWRFCNFWLWINHKEMTGLQKMPKTNRCDRYRQLINLKKYTTKVCLFWSKSIDRHHIWGIEWAKKSDNKIDNNINKTHKNIYNFIISWTNVTLNPKTKRIRRDSFHGKFELECGQLNRILKIEI